MEQTKPTTRYLKKGKGGKGKDMQCSLHQKKQYTVICKTCLILLCDRCIALNEHTACDVVPIDSDADSIYNQLKSRLTDRIKDMRSGVFELHEILVRKKERMLKKRNQTVAEIERYFSRLKEKILRDLNNKEKELTNELKHSVSQQETLVSEHIGQCNRLRHNLSESVTMLNNLDRLYQNTDKTKSDYLQQLHKVSKDLVDYKTDVSMVEATRDSFLVIRFIVNQEGERSMLNRKLAFVEVLNSRNQVDGDASLERSAIDNAQDRQQTAAGESLRSNGHGLVVDLPDQNVYPQNRRSRSAPRLRPRSEIHADRETPTDEARNLLTVPKSASTNSFLEMGTNESSSNNTPEHTRLPDYYKRHRNSPSPVHMRSGHTRERRNRHSAFEPRQSTRPGEADLIDFDSECQAAIRRPVYLRSSPPVTSVDAIFDSVAEPVPSTSQEGSVTTTLDSVAEPLPSTSQEGRAQQSTDRASQSDEVLLNTGVADDQDTGHSSGSEKLPLNDNETTSNIAEDPPPPYPGGSQMPVIPPAPGELPPPYQDDSPPPPYVQYPESSQQNTGQPRRRLYGYSGADTRRKETERINAPTVRVVLDQRSLEAENATNSDFRSLKAIGPIKTFTVNEMYDKRSAGIFAIVYHTEHSFLIVDRWNKKLKYFNDSGISYGGVIFREEPWDIAKESDTIYAVTVPQLKSIYKLTASEESVKTTGVISTDRKYACLAYHAESQRYVCGQVPQFGEPVVDLIAREGGQILLSFKSDNSGISLFSYPRYVKVSRDGVIVVCDWNMKCLMLLKIDGTFVGKYKGSNEILFKDPTGIVINQATGSIYAIASTCEAVHKISLKCELQEVLRGPEEFRDGRAIDSLGDRIVIGCKNGLVNVFATSSQSHRV